MAQLTQYKMLPLLLALSCQAVLSVSGTCQDLENDFPEGCYDEPNIAKIVCMGTEHCVCKDGDGEDDNPCTDIVPANVLFEVTAAEMDGQKCKEICEASKVGNGSSSKCEYFRWEEVSYNGFIHLLRADVFAGHSLWSEHIRALHPDAGRAVPGLQCL